MFSNALGKSAMKRKRVVLPIETKLQIVERVMNGEAYTKLSTEYGIGAQTCRDIFNNRDKLVNFAFSSGAVGACLKRKTVRKANFHDINKAVYQWFQEQRSEGLPITGPMLIEKALWYHKEMKIDEPFTASSGWLSKFKARYNIRQPKTKDDKLIVDEPLIDKFKTDFKKIVKQNSFTLDQIYLADEKVLNWNCVAKLSDFESPDKESSSSQEVPENEKLNNDSITVMACANANGSKKLKLFCTGKCKFINEDDSTFVNYYAVNSDEDSYEKAFQDWYKVVFIPEVKEDLNEKSLPEKALLVIKSADINNLTENDNEVQLISENKNFFVIVLPKIIAELPRMSLSSNNITKNEKFNISLYETFCTLSDAWVNINQEHMQHSSWWWHNLFTEMGKEGIIELRDDITPHFMTFIDAMFPDQNQSLMFTSVTDDTDTEVDECQMTNFDVHPDQEKGFHFVTTNNIKTEFNESKKIVGENFDKDKDMMSMINNIKTELEQEIDETQTDYDISSDTIVNQDHNLHLTAIDNNIKIEVEQEIKENPTTSDKSNLNIQQVKNKSSYFTTIMDNIKTNARLEGTGSTEKIPTNFNKSNSGSLTDFNGIVKTKKCGQSLRSDTLICETNDNNTVSSSRSKNVSLSDAISCADMLLKYLEQSGHSTFNDFLVVRNIKKKLKCKLRNNFLIGP